jgi:hypothetical protein
MPIQLPEHDTNPGSGYPPTRPSLWLVILVLVIVASAVGIGTLSQLSPHLQLSQLKTAIGL